MSRSGRLFLQGMLECARKVVRYTAHLTREQFFSSELEYDATLRNLEILGEAAKKVPDELKHQYPSVDLVLIPSPFSTRWEQGRVRVASVPVSSKGRYVAPTRTVRAVV